MCLCVGGGGGVGSPVLVVASSLEVAISTQKESTLTVNYSLDIEELNPPWCIFKIWFFSIFLLSLYAGIIFFKVPTFIF